MDSKLKIIGNTPKQTKDIKDTITYLENIVINKETLKKLDTAKLVREINRLIQYVEILSEYKKPAISILNEYQRVIDLCNSPFIKEVERKKMRSTKQILDRIVSEAQFDSINIVEKEYWEKYE